MNENPDLEKIAFRHSKHKEIIQEIDKIINSQYPQMKEKLNDLILYVKSRESKIEGLEKELKITKQEVTA